MLLAKKRKNRYTDDRQSAGTPPAGWQSDRFVCVQCRRLACSEDGERRGHEIHPARKEHRAPPPRQ